MDSSKEKKNTQTEMERQELIVRIKQNSELYQNDDLQSLSDRQLEQIEQALFLKLKERFKR